MGIINSLFTYGKARMANRMLRRVVGGNLATAMMLAWAGKKAWNYYQTRNSRRRYA